MYLNIILIIPILIFLPGFQYSSRIEKNGLSIFSNISKTAECDKMRLINFHLRHPIFDKNNCPPLSLSAVFEIFAKILQKLGFFLSKF